uniref:Uncharacterized protein n=1 Tax=Mycena chlorophos TaxID=658473 RepID=A0ABQ0LNT5_MYCCL|nr:predicted protein [Mycena chlorophos]
MPSRKNNTPSKLLADSQRRSKLRYEHSERGKKVRAEGRRTRGKRKRAKIRLPRLALPDIVEDWACAELRTGREVFHDAQTEEFQDDNFAHWLSLPFDANVILSADEPAPTHCDYTWELSCAVDGRLIYHEQQFESELRRQWAELGRRGGIDWLRLEVQRLLAEDWVTIRTHEGSYVAGTREHTIWERHVISLARKIYRMYYLKFLELEK